jgi:ABC-type transport system involved in Fe-S cluster assembly fused permease/ATPase subunit
MHLRKLLKEVASKSIRSLIKLVGKDFPLIIDYSFINIYKASLILFILNKDKIDLI